eukprot:1349523-Rhodomonas_salina.2
MSSLSVGKAKLAWEGRRSGALRWECTVSAPKNPEVVKPQIDPGAAGYPGTLVRRAPGTGHSVGRYRVSDLGARALPCEGLALARRFQGASPLLLSAARKPTEHCQCRHARSSPKTVFAAPTYRVPWEISSSTRVPRVPLSQKADPGAIYGLEAKNFRCQANLDP